MIHVCMICLYMCPCYDTCVWIKEQHWVLVLASAVFGMLSHSWFCQCRLQVSWSNGYAETLFSASDWERWAYRSTPPHPALCNHGNLDSGPTLAQQAFDLLCHLSTLGLAFCFQL